MLLGSFTGRMVGFLGKRTCSKSGLLLIMSTALCINFLIKRSTMNSTLNCFESTSTSSLNLQNIALK
ncbi:hypothetical protein EB796_021742 [Bugula neritina]|uniref:Uncharacterized protein n=1 Tax=Bugula neritina TaxID=10212 RepID=A0A7J7J162_BUGNE|nr:hypothetical protein EB796_021742 [Bugula neritina]